MFRAFQHFQMDFFMVFLFPFPEEESEEEDDDGDDDGRTDEDDEDCEEDEGMYDDTTNPYGINQSVNIN